MRALPGTSRTSARTGAWRVAAVAVLLALTAAGLRSRGTFSHAPDRVLAGASGTVLATALAATEGVALVAFVLVLVMARPHPKPKLDEDEPPRPPFAWWPNSLALLASVADTPAEVLARATGAGLVRSGSAVRMAGLFRRARYSSEPMTSADSAAAAAALDQMQADLGPAHESSARE